MIVLDQMGKKSLTLLTMAPSNTFLLNPTSDTFLLPARKKNRTHPVLGDE